MGLALCRLMPFLHSLETAMNKLVLKKLAAVMALSGAAQTAMAADGEIDFVGTITANTCPIQVTDLNTSDTSGAIGLGNASTGGLTQAGDVGGSGAFSLTIDTLDAGCSVDGKAAVLTLISLSGTAGPSGEWIGITNEAGKAENVAVQIKDAQGNVVKLGENSAPYADPTQPMRFTANYIATGVPTAGPANAKVAFNVDFR